jgi:hypothetical protein
MADNGVIRRNVLRATTLGVLGAAALPAAGTAWADSGTTPLALSIDSANPGHAVSPQLHGAFFEEINDAGVGGIYAELLRNRAFMDPATPLEWYAPDEIPRVPGVFGSALQLGGGSPAQYVLAPGGVVSSLTDFTIAAWVNPAEIETWMRVFDFGAVDTNTSMTLNPSSLGSTTQNYIGRSQWSPDPYLDAVVDEFQIYDYALPAAQLQALQTSAGGSTGGGNVLWYRFDEAKGDVAEDSSGNGNNGVVELTAEDWTEVTDGGATATPVLDTSISLNSALTRSLRLDFGGVAAYAASGPSSGPSSGCRAAPPSRLTGATCRRRSPRAVPGSVPGDRQRGLPGRERQLPGLTPRPRTRGRCRPGSSATRSARPRS